MILFLALVSGNCLTPDYVSGIEEKTQDPGAGRIEEFIEHTMRGYGQKSTTFFIEQGLTVFTAELMHDLSSMTFMPYPESGLTGKSFFNSLCFDPIDPDQQSKIYDYHED